MGQQFRSLSLSLSFSFTVISMSRKTRENVSVCANDGRVNSIAIPLPTSPPFHSVFVYIFQRFEPHASIFHRNERLGNERERERESRKNRLVSVVERDDEKRFDSLRVRFVSSFSAQRECDVVSRSISSESHPRRENDIDRSVVT